MFLDAYLASPPEMTLTIGSNSSHYLIDTPLSKGALDASLKEIHVAVYSFEHINSKDIDYDKLVKAYSKELDKGMDKKAEDLIKIWWKGDRKSFCLHKLVELELNRKTIKLRNKKDFSSDLILITANALYQSFVDVLGAVVSVFSLSELVRILNDLKKEGFFKRSDGSAMSFYDIPQTPAGGFSFPAQFLVDIEMLETFGLMYRLIKVQKFGEKYQQKYQMRISGWGRGYYQRNLSNVQDLLNLFTRLKEYFVKILSDHKQDYENYFEKVRKEPTSRKIATEAKELGRKLPIRVLL